MLDLCPGFNRSGKKYHQSKTILDLPDDDIVVYGAGGQT
jgi:hypothetical protein